MIHFFFLFLLLLFFLTSVWVTCHNLAKAKRIFRTRQPKSSQKRKNRENTKTTYCKVTSATRSECAPEGPPPYLARVSPQKGEPRRFAPRCPSQAEEAPRTLPMRKGRCKAEQAPRCDARSDAGRGSERGPTGCSASASQISPPTERTKRPPV